MESIIITVSNSFSRTIEMNVINTDTISSLVDNKIYRGILEAAEILYETSTLEKVVFCLFSDDIRQNIYLPQNEMFSIIPKMKVKNLKLGIIHRAGSM